MWGTLLKAVISITFFILLFRQTPLHQLKPYFSQMNLSYFTLAFLLQLIACALAALRWSMIMDSLHYVASRTFYLKQYLIGVMFNQILPTSIGGDAYKIIAINQLHQGKKMAALSVLLDRLYGLGGLVIINLCSLPLIYQLLPQHIFMLILFINLAFLAGLVILLAFSILRISFKHFSLRLISDLAELMTSSINSWQDFALKALLATLPNLLTIYLFVLIAQAANISCSFSNFLVIAPSVLLLSMLPVSLGGWGLREGSMVYLGMLIGLSKAEALAISLLFGFNTLLTSIPGLFIYLLEPRAKRQI